MFCVAIALIALLLTVLRAPNVEAVSNGVERRIFEVRTDGKPSGHYEFQLNEKGSATDVVEDCDVNAKLLVLHFQYKYHAHEAWKSNRLVSFDSKRDDNFKHCVLSVQSTGDKLSMTVNGKTPHTVDGDIITSSYWFLPNPGSEKFSRRYLEIDTGRIYDAESVLVGSESIQVGDQKLNCKHYKMTGGDSEDLWYDEQNRLVRQSEIDAGHRTIITLQSIAHA
ncbi:MAG TPA: DUF6134 family protein [Planktothrix sp.]